MEGKHVVNGIVQRQLLTQNRDRPWVIIATMDPGIVKTDIQKHVIANSSFLRTINSIVTRLLFKTPDHGARILIQGGLTTEEQHVGFKPSPDSSWEAQC